VIVWYHLAGHNPAIARGRRDRAPWYATKFCSAYIDMIAKLGRMLIAPQYHPGVRRQPTAEEIPCGGQVLPGLRSAARARRRVLHRVRY